MSRKKIILLITLLSSPIILFVAQHYFIHSPDLKPTGITNSENVLYMSYAHQYLDQEKFSLFYSNPFDGDPQSPKIYFQPAIIVLAGFLNLGMDPGLCFSLFGLIMTLLCVWIGVRILLHLIPEGKNISLLSVLFTWGGGLTAIGGLMGSAILAGHQTSTWIDGIYLADPNNGWWGLNWGRTFFLPLEAYYHFLFLLGIFLMLTKKWKSNLIIVLLLSISHPFTGIEYLLIANGWILVEKYLFKNKDIPYWYWIFLLLITLFHLWYYLFYLNSFPEHKQIFTQYRTGWTYSLLIAAAAYCLVAALTIFNIFFEKPVKKVFAFPHQRLFICWAIIAFLLSKHEWFIKPMQPIHFSRGYVWAGLFLFSLPALQRIIGFLRQKLVRKGLLYVLVFVFLSDNILWTGNLLRGKNDTEWEGHISKDTEDVLSFIEKKSTTNTLLVGNAPLINYIANMYSPANSWVSHPYNTPDREGRFMQMQDFLASGKKPDTWKDREIFIVIDKKNRTTVIMLPANANKLFENSSYLISAL